MRYLILTLLLIATPVYALPAQAKLEKDYQKETCNGVMEYRLDDGCRVDCLTDEYAIEYDFANK